MILLLHTGIISISSFLQDFNSSELKKGTEKEVLSFTFVFVFVFQCFKLAFINGVRIFFNWAVLQGSKPSCTNL